MSAPADLTAGSIGLSFTITPAGDARGALEEDAMKLTASDAHAGADRVPELGQLDFRQLSSPVIQDSLMGHADSSRQHLVRNTKGTESASTVAGEVKAGAARWPQRSALDDLRNEALLSQRSAECETRDSATDDQDA